MVVGLSCRFTRDLWEKQYPKHPYFPRQVCRVSNYCSGSISGFLLSGCSDKQTCVHALLLQQVLCNLCSTCSDCLCLTLAAWLTDVTLCFTCGLHPCYKEHRDSVIQSIGTRTERCMRQFDVCTEERKPDLVQMSLAVPPFACQILMVPLKRIIRCGTDGIGRTSFCVVTGCLWDQ